MQDMTGPHTLATQSKQAEKDFFFEALPKYQNARYTCWLYLIANTNGAAGKRFSKSGGPE
jgi:hypothetical protein